MASSLVISSSIRQAPTCIFSHVLDVLEHFNAFEVLHQQIHVACIVVDVQLVHLYNILVSKILQVVELILQLL